MLPGQIENEVAEYLFRYRRDLLTEAEHAGHRALIFRLKFPHHDPKNSAAFLKFTRFTPEAAQLLENGAEAFYEGVVRRVLSEHRREDVLNLCSKCGGLARTPKARQCPHCFHDWH